MIYPSVQPQFSSTEYPWMLVYYRQVPFAIFVHILWSVKFNPGPSDLEFSALLVVILLYFTSLMDKYLHLHYLFGYYCTL
jgi:hypothetical protein